MIRFAYTILYVRDVIQTLSFYEKAFGFKRKFVAPGNEYGELDTGATILSFAVIDLAKKNLPDGFIESNLKSKPFGIEVGLVTDDVDKTFKKALSAGAVEVQKPKTKPWGQVVSYVRDPEGLLIEICSPVD